MKKVLLFAMVFVAQIGFSQEDAWIYFKDKPNAQSFFNNPLSGLTQRALDRRTTQEIALDSKDAPIHQPYVDEVENSAGITVLAQSKWLNYVHVRGAQQDIANLVHLASVQNIVYANHALNASTRTTVSSSFPQKISKIDKFQDTTVNFDYGNSATQVQMLNCHFLHQQNYTGAGKIIAVLDAGFPGVDTALPFKRLRDNNLILGGYDFVNNSSSFYTGNSHGTIVLSTMGGYATNLVGTAPDAHYYLFITEDVSKEEPLELSNWVEAAEEADRLGVDVINTSLGYFGFDNPNYSYTYAMMNGQTSVASRAVDVAFAKGMICVTSAGNEGASSEPHVGTPADAILNVTVGAVTATEIKSGFSSIGPTADNRIKPDVMAMGTASTVARPDGTVNTANGTSFSGPIIAGAITSFWSAFPNKKNSEIVQMVKGSADKYTTPDNNYGYGIPDMQAALNTALNTNQMETFKAKVFPNPVNAVLSIHVDEGLKNTQLMIYNAMGQKIYDETIQESAFSMQLDSWHAGVYFYTLQNHNKSLQGKFIKN